MICSPSHPGPGEAEPLFLLPTKVEKKRLQLQKMYDRKAKKKLAMEAAGERIPVPGPPHFTRKYTLYYSGLSGGSSRGNTSDDKVQM